MKKLLAIFLISSAITSAFSQGIINSSGYITTSGSSWWVINGSFTFKNEGSGTPATIYNLKITSGSVVTIPPLSSIKVSNSVINSSGTGGLLLKSSASGEGSYFGPSTEATVERYLTKDVYHIITSPVSGKVVSSLVNSSNVGSAIVNGSDLYNFAFYDETVNSWRYYTTGSIHLAETFTVAQGNALKVTSTAAYPFAGTLASAPVSIAVTNTDPRYGWNAIGNPFTSAIGINTGSTAANFLSVNGTNLNASNIAIYLWNGSNKAYETVNNTSPATWIPAGQGFLINVSANKTMSFTAAMQTNLTGIAMRSVQEPWNGFTLSASSGEMQRSCRLAFRDDMTAALDPSYDAGYMQNGDFDIYTKLISGDETGFAIQALPNTGYDTLEIPLGINATAPAEIKFTAASVLLPDACYPILEDRLTGIITALKDETDSYSAPVASTLRGFGRFFIRFANITTTVKDTKPDNALKAWLSGDIIRIDGAVAEGRRARVIDINGRVVAEKQLSGTYQNQIEVADLKPGLYIINIEGDIPLNIKIIKTEKK